MRLTGRSVLLNDASSSRVPELVCDPLIAVELLRDACEGTRGVEG
jgi:hypothetical protein